MTSSGSSRRPHSHRDPSFAAAQYGSLWSLNSYQLCVDEHTEHAITATEPDHVIEPKLMADLEQPQVLSGDAILALYDITTVTRPWNGRERALKRTSDREGPPRNRYRLAPTGGPS